MPSEMPKIKNVNAELNVEKKLPELLNGKKWIKIVKQIVRYIQSENFFSLSLDKYSE